jgi:hypothetical protein
VLCILALELLRSIQVAELADELGPDDPSEGVIAYYQSLCELLVMRGHLIKRRIRVDGDVIPYYRTMSDEQQPPDRAATNTEWFSKDDEQSAPVFDIEQPLAVDIAQQPELVLDAQ